MTNRLGLPCRCVVRPAQQALQASPHCCHCRQLVVEETLFRAPVARAEVWELAVPELKATQRLVPTSPAPVVHAVEQEPIRPVLIRRPHFGLS